MALSLVNPYPDPELHYQLRTEINNRILESLHHILQACQMSEGSSVKIKRLASECDDLVNQINPKRKISFLHHLYHGQLQKFIQADNLEALENALIDYSSLDITNQEEINRASLFDNTHRFVDYQRYRTDHSERRLADYGYDIDYKKLSFEDELLSKSLMNEALQNLADFCPSYYNETRALVSDLITVDSNMLNGSSSFLSLNGILLGPSRPGYSWTRYFEGIVHETGHQYLFHLCVIDPILLNDEFGVYRSPLRKDPRPLSGIYHGMFVLARTIDAIRRITSNPSFDPDKTVVFSTAYNNAKNSASFEQKFEDCYCTLKEHGKLTNLARDLMENCRDLVYDKQTA